MRSHPHRGLIAITLDEPPCSLRAGQSAGNGMILPLFARAHLHIQAKKIGTEASKQQNGSLKYDPAVCRAPFVDDPLKTNGFCLHFE
ncbi:unnamed protein product [Angiostrongylus costaricensis]|uniref:Uncharacterized protein n=1 Tax=Angiostrongylus costaricensis TaxID=334426 RepID=A0A0R3PBV5_ANGCS|nr:unnamed protein product [Angiostrongylus costaricensis]